MINRLKRSIYWLRQRPLAITNVVLFAILIFGIFGYLIYNSTRSIDVLHSWTLALSEPTQTRKIDGKTVAVYNPGSSLVFTSKSTKRLNAKGVTTRMIICDATDKLKEREIQLDQLVAGRPAGNNPPRENAVVVPEVTQFQGLPRWCRLAIDIVYENVEGTSRSWNEHAETERFIVEEQALTTKELLNKIRLLENEVKDLKAQLPVKGDEMSGRSALVSPQTTPTAGGSPVVTRPSNNANQPAQPSAPAPTPDEPTDNRSVLGDLPIIGGILDRLGL